MKSIVIGLALIAAIPAMADSWKGKDKDGHAIVGAVVGAGVTYATGNAWHGCAAATGVGLAKEIYDAQHKHKHTVSFKDFAVTAAAGCLSAKATSVFVTPNKIVFSWKF